jgi:hypothetical protein
LSVFWPLCCLSFGHCVVCLLAIVLSVFWPLCCLSFGHCVVCLLAIVLSVFRFPNSDYPFGIVKLFLLFRFFAIWNQFMTFQSLRHFKMSQSMPGSSITMYDQYTNLANYMRVYYDIIN